MKIQGYFNNIDNSKTYWIQIGDYGIVKYIKDSLEELDEQSICWGVTPITINSDMSDTLENVYIRSCQVNLISNFDIRDLVVADNYTDIPIEIRYDDSEGDVIFSGFVNPLSFNQDFALDWNEFTLSCVDKLGLLEYIKFPPLLSDYNYATPHYFIDLILDECGFSNVTYNIEYDQTNNTQINPIVFMGESEDDWLNCKEVLEEIGKVYGCYFYQNGDDCVVENILLYNLNNPIRITKDDYMSNDTNISIQEAFNRIECKVDLVGIKEALVDPFSDNELEYVGVRAERVLSEVSYNLGNKQTWDLFMNFKNIVNDQVPIYKNWQQYNNTDENFYEYDYYCRIMRNDMYSFGSTNYLNAGYGDTGNNIWRTLKWLHDNPGKGAFLEFSKTQNLVDTKKRSTLDIESDKQQMLLIQVGGHGRSYKNGINGTVIPQHAQALETQFIQNSPICSIEVSNANNFVPTDVTKTNYLVISGKLRLNPLQCRTGFWYEYPAPPGGNGSYNTDSFTPWNPDVMSQNTVYTLLSNWANIDWSYGSYYLEQQTMGQGGLWSFYSGKVYKNNNDAGNGLYYQYYGWDNIAETEQPDGKWPFNQTQNYTRAIALPYLSPNTMLGPYDTSTYKSAVSQDITGVTKCAILACELSIGEGANKKYLVENLDILRTANYKQIPFEVYSQLYQWKTEAECPEIGGVKQKWFTIGVCPDKGDFIIGKELEIQNTVSSQMDLPTGTKGTAIPVTSTDKLQGKLEFKILGPYNAKWYPGNIVKHGWDWSRYFGYDEGDRYLMDYVENIQITDLQIKPYANGQLTRVAGFKSATEGDKDLIYYSDTNDIYTESKEFSCKICSCLDSDECKELGLTFGLTNSTILTTNNDPFYGMNYKDGSTGVKLEEARVSEQYNIWKRPRKIIDTSLKLIDPEKAYIKNNYMFSYLKYPNNQPQIYKILTREIDLKYDAMTCSMKELSDEAN